MTKIESHAEDSPDLFRRAAGRSLIPSHYSTPEQYTPLRRHPLEDKRANELFSLLERNWGIKEKVDDARHYHDGRIDDLIEVAEATDLLISALEDHKRKGIHRKEPASTHSIEVAKMIADEYESRGLTIDKEVIIASLLHDVPEETKKYYPDRTVTINTIKDLYGQNVSAMVDSVTKVRGSKFRDMGFRTKMKIFDSLLMDPRTILIKLADRLHNMRTIEGIENSNKRHHIATETLTIYIPLARQLGLNEWADELSNRCFEVLHKKHGVFYDTRREYTRRLNDGKLDVFRNIVDSYQHNLPNDIRDKIVRIDVKKPSLYDLVKRNEYSFPDLDPDEFVPYLTYVLKDRPLETVDDQTTQISRRAFADILWESDLAQHFTLANSLIGDFGEGAYDELMNKIKNYSVSHLRGRNQINGEYFTLRFLSESEYEKEQANLFDVWRNTNDERKKYAEEKIRRLQHVVHLAKEKRKPTDVAFPVREIINNLDVELVRVFTKEGDEKIIPRGTVRDAAYAFRTDLGDNTISCLLTRNGTNIPLSMDYFNILIREEDQLEFIEGEKHQDIMTVDWLDYVTTRYAKDRIARQLRKRIEEEKELPELERFHTKAAMRRGHDSLKIFYTKYADRIGTRSRKLLVNPDKASEAWQKHHRKHPSIPGDPADRSQQDFLIHLGLEELNMFNYGRETIKNTVGRLLTYQRQLIPIHITVADIPGAERELSGFFADRGINLEGLESEGDVLPGSQKITYLITPQARERMTDEFLQNLRALAISKSETPEKTNLIKTPIVMDIQFHPSAKDEEGF